MNYKLTPADKAFCIAIEMEGMSNTEAYKECYDCEGMKAEHIASHASRKAAHPKIKEYRIKVAERVGKKLESLAIWNKEKALTKLVGIGEQAEQFSVVEDDEGKQVHRPKSASVAISAYAEANKVAGLNQETVNLEGMLTIENFIDGLGGESELPDTLREDDDE